MAPGYFTTANVQQFQDLMYRPLYWMGKGSTPDLNPTLSLAKPPVYGPGNTVVITLKPYKWSDGESLDARDVMFWMNMLHAEKVNWAAYTPGAFPDNVVNVVADSSDPADLHLGQGLQPGLVHLQRALPDHTDAAGLGHHRQGRRAGIRAMLGGRLRKPRPGL